MTDRSLTPARMLLSTLLAPPALAGCGPSGATQAQIAAKRGACEFTPGQLASDTVPATFPTGSKIPIDHIVLVMQENRSFDHFLGTLSHGGVDVASLTATNPDAEGHPVSRFHDATYCFDDTAHGWESVHTELNGNSEQAKIDGFVIANDPHGERAMGYYDETDIPFAYGLARTFAISDRHFCSVLGPTWPNRMFYMAGRSFGYTNNIPAPDKDPEGNPYPNLFLALNKANVTWQVYSQDVPTPAMLVATYGDNLSHMVSGLTFATDLQNGKLPSISMVEGTDLHGGANVDQHPPGDMQIGEKFLSDIVNGVMNSPYWKSTAIFITYDSMAGSTITFVPRRPALPMRCRRTTIRSLGDSTSSASACRSTSSPRTRSEGTCRTR